MSDNGVEGVENTNSNDSDNIENNVNVNTENDSTKNDNICGAEQLDKDGPEMVVEPEKSDNLSGIKAGAISAATAAIMTLCDFISFGKDLFKADDSRGSDVFGEMCRTLSLVAFCAGTVLSNVVFNFASSLNTAFVAGVILEAKQSFNSISGACHRIVARELTKQNANASDDVIAAQSALCTWVVCSFTTLLFAGASGLVAQKKLGNACKKVPLLAVNAVMLAIGLFMLKDPISDAKELFERVKEAKTAAGEKTDLWAVKSYGYVALVLGLAAVVWAIDNFAPFQFLLPAAAVAVAAAVHLVWHLSLKKEAPLFKPVFFTGALNTGVSAIFKFTDQTTTGVDFGMIISCLLENIGEIITVTIFNMIHINVNVPSFVSCTGKEGDYDLNREWKAQALSNAATSVVGFPSYFVNCYSLLVAKLGCGYSQFALVFAGVFALLGIALPFVVEYIPLLVGHVLLSYMGMVFIQCYGYEPFRAMNGTDATIWAAGVVLSYFCSTALGFCFVIAAISLSVLKAAIAGRKRQVKPVYGDEVNYNTLKYVKIDYPVYFLTLDEFAVDLQYLESGFTLDLTGCSYIDMGGNAMLEEKLNEIGIINVYGTPANLYTKRLQSKINIIA
ncbi:hypothetical protein ECANGB1_2229 [Enterospora canceri]|uniref:Uncharacterized protein n=1 Tax=Enterospora canceri TaxID=1081671 RepID=A0A1Y1S8N8_9MICR|nr:hypothetical protein ECANGB1_2229 [Enterospora canceri]